MSAVKSILRHKRRVAAPREADEEASAPKVVRSSAHGRAPPPRAKVMAVISRSSTSKFSTLMEGWVRMLPHVRKDCKLENKDRLQAIPEMAELAGCNAVMYYEVRKHQDLFLWLSIAPSGPSTRLLVQAVHTADELAYTGNCLCGSRGIVVFSSAFDDPARPHLALVRVLLQRVFAVPEGHPQSKPFVDHCHSFMLDEGTGKIIYRHYQIGNEDPPVLAEIGPRCALTIVRVFGDAFGGQTLYANGDYVAPNAVRAALRRRTGERYARKLNQRQARRKRTAEADRQIPRDALADVFRGGDDDGDED